jgi:heptaprenyl diphosphate synthase/octaprenyl-diphosphate synthase
MATAVELLHIASLVHDDTVDRAETRRGRTTVSNEWGGKVAVLLGDYVFATSAIYVCDTENIGVIRRFSETIMELARGELAEHFSAYDWSQTRQDYERRIYDKAAESGAILSEAPPEAVATLKAYGYNLGMAFQIMDDVLDFEGTEEELGKPVGNDLLQGTLTLPALLHAEHHPEAPVVQALRDGSREPEDLAAMVEAIRASGVMAETLGICEGYRNAAREALDRLPSGDARQSLGQLTDYVTARRS